MRLSTQSFKAVNPSLALAYLNDLVMQRLYSSESYIGKSCDIDEAKTLILRATDGRKASEDTTDRFKHM